MNLLEFILLFFFGFIRVNTLNSIPLSSRFLFICNFSSVYFFLKTTFPQFVVISIHLIASFVPLSARSLTKRGVSQSFHTDSNTQRNYGCPFFRKISPFTALFNLFLRSINYVFEKWTNVTGRFCFFSFFSFSRAIRANG